MRLDDLIIGKKLGKGAFGHVYQCSQRRDPERKPWALKVVEKHHASLVMERELHLMKKATKHPNVMHLEAQFRDRRRLFLLLPFQIGGDVYRYSQQFTLRRVPMDRAAQISRDVARGIAHLHQHNIIHRDIKPENILIGEDGGARITDFGWSADLDTDSDDEFYRRCGTLEFLSPEMVDGQRRHGKPTDVWSFGVLVAEMLTGKSAFEANENTETMKRIRSGQYHPIPDWIDEDAKHLIECALKQCPEERPTADDILCVVWIANASETAASPCLSEWEDDNLSDDDDNHILKLSPTRDDGPAMRTRLCTRNAM